MRERKGREERGKNREKRIHMRECDRDMERDRESDAERMILQEGANMVNYSSYLDLY